MTQTKKESVVWVYVKSGDINVDLICEDLKDQSLVDIMDRYDIFYHNGFWYKSTGHRIVDQNIFIYTDIMDEDDFILEKDRIDEKVKELD